MRIWWWWCRFLSHCKRQHIMWDRSSSRDDDGNERTDTVPGVSVSIWWGSQEPITYSTWVRAATKQVLVLSIQKITRAADRVRINWRGVATLPMTTLTTPFHHPDCLRCLLNRTGDHIKSQSPFPFVDRRIAGTQLNHLRSNLKSLTLQRVLMVCTSLNVEFSLRLSLVHSRGLYQLQERVSRGVSQLCIKCEDQWKIDTTAW